MARVTGGVLEVGGGGVGGGGGGSVTTDTRKVGPGQWFVALRGDRFDGNAFLAEARARGAFGCVGEVPAEEAFGGEGGGGFCYVRVGDGLEALQGLARDVRRRFEGPVVGVTGSCGKTTTRAMVALALGPVFGDVHATEGNLNNHVGVPLTLLQTPAGARAMVLEMGMNHAGEIALLQDIGRPTVRVVTNVGPVHLEGLGTIEAVAKAKGEMFDGALEGDVCVKNADDTRVAALPVPAGCRVVTFGETEGADVRLAAAEVALDGSETTFTLEHAGRAVRGRCPGPGLHLARNAAAAVCVAVTLGVDFDAAVRALEAYAPVGMRMRTETSTGPLGITVLNDCYNANPLSSICALEMLAGLEGAAGAASRRVAFLGDMLELGPATEASHADLVAELAGAYAETVPLAAVCGPAYGAAVAGAPPSARVPRAFASSEDLARAVSSGDVAMSKGDVVLVKGSRSIGMEAVVAALLEL